MRLQTMEMTFLTFLFADNDFTNNTSVEIDNATCSIFETATGDDDIENMDVELSSTENDVLSIEFSIAESLKILNECTTVPHMDIAENAKNASKNENKDEPTKGNEKASDFFVVIHSNENDTSISNIVVDNNAALLITSETAAENGDTENTEVDLSTTEDGSIESSIVNSADKTMESNIDIVAKNAQDTTSKSKDVLTSNRDDRFNKFFSNHSLETSNPSDAVDDAATLSISAETSAKNADTKNMDMELSTIEDVFTESAEQNLSISNSDGKTMIANDGEDASKNKGKKFLNINNDFSNIFFCRRFSQQQHIFSS